MEGRKETRVQKLHLATGKREKQLRTPQVKKGPTQEKKGTELKVVNYPGVFEKKKLTSKKAVPSQRQTKKWKGNHRGGVFWVFVLGVWVGLFFLVFEETWERTKCEKRRTRKS